MKLKRLLLVLVAVVILLTGTVLGPAQAMAASNGTTIALNYSTKDVDVGHGFMLSATVTSTSSGTLVWSTSNSYVATVSTSGFVSGVHAGTATITATYTSGGVALASASCKVYVTVEDGIYYIKNAYSDLCLSGTAGRMSLQNQQSNATYRVSQLWHISFDPGHNRYIIRPVKDFSVAMGVSSDMYVAVEDLEYETCWDITHNSFGYTIKYYEYSNGNAKPIVADQPGSEVYVGTWETSLKCHWELEKAHGIFFRDSQTGKLLTADDVITIPLNASGNLNDVGVDVSCYGNVIGAMTWSASNASSIGVNSYTGAINAVDYGESTIRVSATLNGTGYSAAVTLRTSIPEGEYIIKNCSTQYFLSVEKQINSTGTILTNRIIQERLDADASQTWIVEHIHNGAYNIKIQKGSVVYYLSPESDSPVVGTNLVLSTKPTAWKIEGDGSGAFEILLESNSSLNIVMWQNVYKDPAILDEKNVASQNNQWVFALVGNVLDVEWVGQEKSKWCWVACAQMFASYYYSGISGSQYGAVYAVKNNVENEMGNQIDVINAVEYYISTIDGATLDLEFALNQVYTKDGLIRLIDEEHVVYVNRQGFDTFESMSSWKHTGHSMIIVGYVLVNGEYRFVAKDPDDGPNGKGILISYEKLFCGANNQWDEEPDDRCWYAVVNITMPYTVSMTLWYWEEALPV